MKIKHLILFMLVTLLLAACVTANNDTDNFHVTTSKSAAKMGDTLTFSATKQSNDTSPVIFKVNHVTVKDKNNNTLKARPKDGLSSINYTIPDGWRAKPVTVTAVTSIDGLRCEKDTTFNITPINIKLNNTKTLRENNTIYLNTTLLDEHDHRVMGTNTFAVKVNGVTLKGNLNKTTYFNTDNSTLKIQLPDTHNTSNITLTLVTGNRYSYNGLRTNLSLKYIPETTVNVESMIVDNNSKIYLPVNVTTNSGELVGDGRVYVYLDGRLLGSNALVDGQKTVYIDRQRIGNHTIRIVYNSTLYKTSGKAVNLTVMSNHYKTRITPHASVFVKLYTSVSKSDIDKWLKADITDVYVQVYRPEDDTNKLKEVIRLCNNTRIKVHAWVICFNENYNEFDISDKQQLNVKNYIRKLVAINGVEGICLDYVRYPGTNLNVVNASMITNFVKECNDIIKTYNPFLELSVCVFPEMEQTVSYYGQDYANISRYADYIMPMAYKYSYNAGTQWLVDVTSYVVARTQHAKVVPILMTYKDPNSIGELVDLAELTSDVNSVLSAGADGYSLFYKTAIKDYPKVY